MIYLEKEDIVFINKRTLETHGGLFMPPYNFLHEENLDYIDAVQAVMFGEELYPSITDKASVYCHSIICNHIFADGNKRTGLEAGLAFLKFNGMRLNKTIIHEDLYDFIIQVASGGVSLDECRAWFAKNSVLV